MPDYTTSPNMNLIVPTVSAEPGPTWASDLNASLSIVDQHNHSPGSGVQITQDGISLSAAGAPFDSLSFSNSNAYALRSVRFTAQSAALALATDVACAYVAGVDFYYNDGSGNQVRITQGGSLAGAAGTITGLPSGTASASYSGGTFVWQSATSTAANMDAGTYILRNSTASSKGLTLQPPNAMAADYSLTLPSVPGSTSIMQLDSSGNMSAVLVVDNSTLQNSGTVLSVKSSGITATQIANSTITGSKIANNIALPGTGVTIGSKTVVTPNVTSSTLMCVSWGIMSSSGGFDSGGEGMVATNTSTGVYNLGFVPTFLVAPAVIITPINSAVNIITTHVKATGAGSMDFYVLDGGGTPINQQCMIIVMGQRS